MPVIKCSNCGANLPPGAAFCPNCGTPRAAEQPMTTTPIYHSSSGSNLNSLFDIIFSKNVIIIGIAIGMLLAWVSLLILVFASNSYNIAVVLNSIGFIGIGLLFVGGGVFNNNIDKFVRLGMVLIGGYIILMSLGIPAILSRITSFLP